MAFDEPGDHSYDIGILLHIFDACFDSTFAAAPVLAKNDEYYYVGSGALDIAVTYDPDTVTSTTEQECGPYTI